MATTTIQKAISTIIGFAMWFEEPCRGSEKAAEHSRAAAAGFKIEYQ
jgi:hypothetical protein